MSDRDSTLAEARSIRMMRLRARAPRILLCALVAILCLGGLRSIVEDPVNSAPVGRPRAQLGDLGARAFAESFARVYLSWGSDLTERERQLAPFLPAALDASGGLTTAEGDAQDVLWTAVVGAQALSGREIVTVAAQTTRGTRYLSVPVARDHRGFLYVASYPAFVGPPATADEAPLEDDDEVEDADLAGVVQRALSNYLAGAKRNLLADLTPGAVVSLPPEPMRVVQRAGLTWIDPDRRVAAEVEAEDERGSSWTLRYELDVRKRDRWYVRSLQVDPTFRGGA